MALNRCADIDTVRVGDTASCPMRIDRAQIDAFAALSGDVNRLHLDAGVARAQGFARPVAHGMLSLSIISRLIGTTLPGHGSLWVSQTVRFSAAVLEGDDVVAHVTVEQVSRATGLVVLRTEVRNAATGASVLEGTARVRVVSAATETV
jgi:acyl dehydratase